jgi:hypothetical protein
MSEPDYPYLGEIGLWQVAERANTCYACHHEIPAGERYFAFGAEGTTNRAIPPGGTPYHRDCALYVFSTGDKPPQLFAYGTSREELRYPLPEPDFPSVPGNWRTARRSWMCRHCVSMIRVGERYFEYTGESAAYESGRPYHRACAIEVWTGHEPSAENPPVA